MTKRVNTYSTFLETIGKQQPSFVEPQQRAASATVSAAEQIIETLRVNDDLDMRGLLDSCGGDMIELGRALERLQSLGAVQIVGDAPNQRIRLGAKWQEVLSIMR